MKKYNIFYTHKGVQDYLKISIEHTKKHLRNCEVILLGDEANKNVTEKWENLENLENEYTKRLKKSYKHLSTNIEGYEYFCIVRWFYILEYMKRNNIDRGCYMDSDILFNELPSFVLEKDFYFTGESGGLSFFTYEVLDEICQYILSFYEDKEKFALLKKEHKEKMQSNLFGGISDMTFISRYGYEHGYTDTLGIHNLSAFDHHINSRGIFQFNKGGEAIYWIKGDFYFKNEQSRLYIKCNTLHFQGDAKQFMKYFSPTGLNQNKIYIFDYETLNWENIENYKFVGKKTFKMILRQYKYKIKKRIETRKLLKK